MKRTIALLSLSLLMVGALLGCGEGKESAVSGTEGDTLANPNITILYWAPDISQDTHMTKIVERFEKKYGGKVTVKGVSTSEQYVTQITALYSSDESPDWIGCYEYEMQPLMESNVLQDLTPYIDLEDESLGWDAMSRLKRDGKFYGITDKPGASLLFYNKRIFENAGETMPYDLFKEGKWDWKTFSEIAKRLTVTNADGTVSQWGFETYSYNSILRSNDSMYVRAKEDGGYDITIKDENTTTALQFFQDIYVGPNRFGKYDATAWDKDFMNGNTAMLLGFNWMAEMYFFDQMDDEIGIVPFPYGPNVEEKSAPGSDYWYHGSVSGCQNPEGFAAFVRESIAYYREESEKNMHPGWTEEHKDVLNTLKEYKVYGGYPSALLVNSNFVWGPIAQEGKPVSQVQETLIPYFTSLIKAKEAEKTE